MELKEFSYLVEDDSTPPNHEWDYREDYAVLYVPGDDFSSERYIVNAEEPGHSWQCMPSEIDRYVEILNWMREHQASLAKPSTEDRTDPAGTGAPLDDPNPVEEEG